MTTRIYYQPIAPTELQVKDNTDYDKHFVWTSLQETFGHFPIVLTKKHKPQLEALAAAYRTLCIQRRQQDAWPFDRLIGVIDMHGKVQVMVSFAESEKL